MIRLNTGKPKLSLLPGSFLRALDPVPFYGDMEFILGVVSVLTFGLDKYPRDNWRKGGSWMQVLDSALRHLVELQHGAEIDTESGLHHLYHAACNVTFLIEFAHKNTATDDRWNKDGPDYNEIVEPVVADIVCALLWWRDGGPNSILIRVLQALSKAK